jgi:hypothetical protein
VIKLFGASVVGTSHVQSETPCHDAHRYRILPDNWGYIACVSDGMGSAKAAEIGSDVASSFIVNFLETHLDPKLDDEDVLMLIKEGFVEVHDQLLMASSERELKVKDLNATLLVFVTLGKRQFYGQVGDCSAIGKLGDNYHVLVEQQRGEYANATFSVCDLQSIENGIYEKIEGYYPMVALMTDGIEGLSISAKDKQVSHLFYDPFFQAFQNPKFHQKDVEAALTRFLNSERINKKTDDDKTLLFIYAEDV